MAPIAISEASEASSGTMAAAAAAAVKAAHITDKYSSTSSAVASLPVIDFTGFDDGAGPHAQEVADAFYTACRDVGFAYITNFGMDLKLVEEMFGWSKRYFELPKEVKMKAPHPRGELGWWHRGYTAEGANLIVQLPHDATDEQIAEYKRNRKWPDSKEAFDFGSEYNLRMPNICLPDADLPGFRNALNNYYAHGSKCALTLLRALEMGMPHVPEGYLVEAHREGENQIRLLHYAPQNTKALREGEVGRIGEHTDYGVGTILFQDNTGGLEVEDPNNPGTFLQARPLPNHAIFNIGDFLQRWSNNVLRSTLHRVRCPPDVTGDITPERFSMPFFFKTRPDFLIDCLPGTFNDTDRPKAYAPITAAEYINARMLSAYKN